MNPSSYDAAQPSAQSPHDRGETSRFCPRCDLDLDDDRCPYDGALALTLVATEHVQRIGAGDVVGSYRLVRPLGSGGHGAVWLATHASGVGDAAVKVLHPEGVDRLTLRRFFREAEIGSRLRHASAVRVFELGQHRGGSAWLAMELLPGQTLETTLGALADQDAVMAPHRAIRLFAGVLGGLAEAHALGVVHRDLKPKNLMIVAAGGEEQMKILDFGIARLLGTTMTDDGRVLGTTATMSPEQCEGRPLDARSDLYSLGVVLFRCLAGAWPFAGHDPMATMYAHIHVPPCDIATVAPQPLPAALAAVVMRSLAKDPTARFADARAMRAALLACLDSADDARPDVPIRLASGGPLAGGVTRKRGSIAPAQPRGPRRRTVALLLAGAGAVVAVAGWWSGSWAAGVQALLARRAVSAPGHAPGATSPSEPPRSVDPSSGGSWSMAAEGAATVPALAAPPTEGLAAVSGPATGSPPAPEVARKPDLAPAIDVAPGAEVQAAPKAATTASKPPPSRPKASSRRPARPERAPAAAASPATEAAPAAAPRELELPDD